MQSFFRWSFHLRFYFYRNWRKHFGHCKNISKPLLKLEEILSCLSHTSWTSELPSALLYCCLDRRANGVLHHLIRNTIINGLKDTKGDWTWEQEVCHAGQISYNTKKTTKTILPTNNNWVKHWPRMWSIFLNTNGCFDPVLLFLHHRWLLDQNNPSVCLFSTHSPRPSIPIP